MSKGLAITFAVGLLVIGALVFSVFYAKQGAHLVPRGSILKIRTQKVDDANSLMVVDFRLVNNADYAMVIRKVDLTIDGPSGNTLEGLAVAAADAKKLFSYYRLLGDQFNEALRLRDQVPPHQTVDRMMAFQLDVPYADLEARKKVTLRIEDVTGPVVEFSSP